MRLKQVSEHIKFTLEYLQAKEFPLSEKEYISLTPAIRFWLGNLFKERDYGDISDEDIASFAFVFGTNPKKTIHYTKADAVISFHSRGCVYKHYTLYCEEIHNKLLDIQAQYPENEHNKIYEASLEARHFLHILESITSSKELPEHLTEEFINFLLELPLSEQDKRHLEKFYQLMFEDWEVGETGFERVGGKRVQKRTLFRDPFNMDSFIEHAKASSKEPEAVIENTKTIKINLPASFTNTLASKRMQRHAVKNAIQRQRTITMSDYDIAQLYEIKHLIGHYKSSDTDKDKFISTLLIVSAMTGINATEINLAIRKNSRLIKFDSEFNFYYYDLHDIGYENLSFREMTKNAIPTSKVVKIYLPVIIKEMLSRLGPDIEVSSEDVILQLNLMNNLYDTELSEARIRKFFWAYAQERCQISKIICSYISNNFTEMTYTQSFYTQVSAKEIYNQHSDLVSTLLAETGDSDLAAIGENYQRFDDRYGSKAAPTIQTVRYIINSVKNMVVNCNSKRERLNYLSLYTYFGFQIATSIRPITQISRTDLDADLKSATIRDKDSDAFAEFRIIPLCDVISTQIRNLFEEGNITIPEQSFALTDILFLRKRDGDHIYFERKHLEKMLFDKIGIGKNELSTNFARHFLRTELLQRHVSYGIIDYWLGHSTEGTELINKYSFADIQKINAIIVDLQNTLLSEVGFEVLS